jgi:hypothetical protein
MSNLPPDVRASIARANEIQAAMTAPAETPPGAPAPETPPSDQTPTPATPPAAAPAPAPASSTTVDTRTGEGGDATYWMQRFKTVQGMNDALRRDAKAQGEQFAEQLATLSEQVAQLKQVATAPAVPQHNDAEVFGNDLVEMTRRVADERVTQAVQQAVAPLAARNQQLEQQVQALTGQTAVMTEQDFFDRLDRARPDWEQINVRPQWLDWLAETDPMTGYVRQALLDDAISKRSLERTVAIFTSFAGPYQTATQTPAVPVSPAPRTVGAAPVAAQRADDNTGPLITRTEIANFYRDVAAGAYRDKPEKKKQMDDLITQAAKTGRIGV